MVKVIFCITQELANIAADMQSMVANSSWVLKKLMDVLSTPLQASLQAPQLLKMH